MNTYDYPVEGFDETMDILTGFSDMPPDAPSPNVCLPPPPLPAVPIPPMPPPTPGVTTVYPGEVAELELPGDDIRHIPATQIQSSSQLKPERWLRPGDEPIGVAGRFMPLWIILLVIVLILSD